MHINATTATSHVHHHDGHAQAAALEGRSQPTIAPPAPASEQQPTPVPGRTVDVRA